MPQLCRFGVTTAPFSRLKNWRKCVIDGLCQLVVLCVTSYSAIKETSQALWKWQAAGCRWESILSHAVTLPTPYIAKVCSCLLLAGVFFLVSFLCILPHTASLPLKLAQKHLYLYGWLPFLEWKVEGWEQCRMRPTESQCCLCCIFYYHIFS